MNNVKSGVEVALSEKKQLHGWSRGGRSGIQGDICDSKSRREVKDSKEEKVRKRQIDRRKERKKGIFEVTQ